MPRSPSSAGTYRSLGPDPCPVTRFVASPASSLEDYRCVVPAGARGRSDWPARVPAYTPRPAGPRGTGDGVSGEVNRRDVIRWGLLGGAALPFASLLAACSDGASSSGAARRSGVTSNRTTAPYDPHQKWWLQQNFGPVSQEVEAFDLEVVKGAIPAALAGLYVRNGSNPQSGDSSHWFFGDGMVHGVRLERRQGRLVPEPLRAHRAVRRQGRLRRRTTGRSCRTSRTCRRSGTATGCSRAARSGSRTSSRRTI